MLEPSSSEDENDDVPVEDDSSDVMSQASAAAAVGNVPSALHHPATLLATPASIIQRSVSPVCASAAAVAADSHSTYASSPLQSSHSPSPSDRLALPQSSKTSHPSRPTSPSPSTVSESKQDAAAAAAAAAKAAQEEAERAEKEEAERKNKLQLYVFILRCIAYPFNAKQPTDMTRRLQKVTRTQLEGLMSRFQAFLKGEMQLAADEAFHNAIQTFYETFLRSSRLQLMVNSGACSTHDFKEVFRTNVEKRIRSLPEIDGLSKETVLSSWMSKFDVIYRGDEDTKKVVNRTPQQIQQQQLQNLASELILSKEQLYDMFQSVLSIKKFEHQLLYNALQVSISFKQMCKLSYVFLARRP